jgi:MFS family permease
VSVLWNVAHYAAIPFYGSYQRTELGFSMTFISVLSALYAVCRSAFSRPLGRLADKHSFSSMLNVCFVVVAVGFSVNAFTVPSNGKVLYTVYYMLYAIGMAGINSSEINLIYDYVVPEKRVVALALKSTLAGFAGFFTTLIVSPLVSYIQNSGNALFGLHVYAQQVCSALAVIGTLIALLYLNVVVKKIKVNCTQQPIMPEEEQPSAGESSGQ